MKKFTAQSIDFSYTDKPLLTQASLEVAQGDIVGILGPNGSGKTTFFDIVCELKKAKSGLIKNDFSQFLYLSQIITTPPPLRMRDIFKMVTALSSSEPMTQDKTLKKLSAWSPAIVDRYQDIWNKKSSLCSYGETRWFFTLSSFNFCRLRDSRRTYRRCRSGISSLYLAMPTRRRQGGHRYSGFLA